MMTDSTPARELGRLSAEGESGHDPGIVSSGRGDAGGKSYGLYQMTSLPNGGTVSHFLRRTQWWQQFQTLSPGSAEFDAAWKRAAADPKFADAQHEYIKGQFYDPLMEQLATRCRNMYGKSLAVRNVLWALSVAMGPCSARCMVMNTTSATMSDSEIIQAIYAELLRPGAGGLGLRHWARNSPAVQEAVKRTLPRRRDAALRMLQKEERNA